MLYQLSYEAPPIGSEVNLPMKALTLKRAIQGHIYMKYSGIPIFRTSKENENSDSSRNRR